MKNLNFELLEYHKRAMTTRPICAQFCRLLCVHVKREIEALKELCARAGVTEEEIQNCSPQSTLIYLYRLRYKGIKVNVDLYSDLVVNTPLRRSGMARVLNGSHSFTCTPRIHPLQTMATVFRTTLLMLILYIHVYNLFLNLD